MCVWCVCVGGGVRVSDSHYAAPPTVTDSFENSIWRIEKVIEAADPEDVAGDGSAGDPLEFHITHIISHTHRYQVDATLASFHCFPPGGSFVVRTPVRHDKSFILEDSKFTT